VGEELPDEKLVLVLIGSFRFHGRLVAWGKQSGGRNGGNMGGREEGCY
jgi:hypothetical protein